LHSRNEIVHVPIKHGNIAITIYFLVMTTKTMRVRTLKTSVSTPQRVSVPVFKDFTIGELQEIPINNKVSKPEWLTQLEQLSNASQFIPSINVPKWQRWVNEHNIESLINSILAIGIQRTPNIGLIKDTNTLICNDGNHLRLALLKLVLNKHMSLSDKIPCVYTEYATKQDAAKAFATLNTTGKVLDLTDITHLWMHIYGQGSVYYDIWYTIFGNPSNKPVTLPKGFTVATAIEFIAGDKSEYFGGKTQAVSQKLPSYVSEYSQKLGLFSFMITGDYATLFWENALVNLPIKLGKRNTTIRPNGPVILGFAKSWFSRKQKPYNHPLFIANPNQAFLDVTRDIYLHYGNQIAQGIFYLGRDNAKKVMDEWLLNKYQIV
jgi:hypothetical protein